MGTQEHENSRYQSIREKRTRCDEVTLEKRLQIRCEGKNEFIISLSKFTRFQRVSFRSSDSTSMFTSK